jgi:hypothetical protein
MGLSVGLLDWFNPTKAVGEVAGSAAGQLLNGVGDFALKLRGAITGELPPEARAKLEELAKQMELTQISGQLAINLEEAKSEKWWKAGWRPAVGWICAGVLAYTYLFQPMLAFLLRVSVWAGWLHVATADEFPAFPTLDTGAIIQLLIGMLGLAGLRTAEKIKGVS